MGQLLCLFFMLCLGSQDGGGITRTSGFAQATKEAARRNVPVVVFVHGSDWNRLGMRLDTGVWQSPRTWRMLDAAAPQLDLVVTDVDVLQAPTPEKTEAFKSLNAGWKKQGLVTYPAFIALAPDGAVLGSRQGETLPQSPDEAREALFELAGAAGQANVLRMEVDEAAKRGDTRSEIEAIHRMFDLPLDRPTAMLARLEVIDPDDSSGLRRRESMPPWHALIAEATKDASEGRSVEALGRIESLLSDDTYTDRQRAWLHVATGAVHRKVEGSDEDAAVAFKKAWMLDPGGIAGNTGMRWYLRFHSDPSLLFGWMPRNCSGESVQWVVEDLPDRLEPGVHELTFLHVKGRHGLAIEGVELLRGDGGAVLARDEHEGFAGSRNRDNVYTLTVTEVVESPRLRIRCRSDGGRNSHGTITLEGPLRNAG